MLDQDQDGSGGGTVVPHFDVALWGYDRRQVEQCIEDLAARLDAALSELESVGQLRHQLSAAQLELDQLRNGGGEPAPAWSDRLAEIMAAAERLRDSAERDAERIRAGAYAG